MITFTCTTAEDPDDKEYMVWIYEEFQHLMFYTAKKYVHDQTACEDIVQECIVKLMQKIDIIRGKERCILTGYIVSIIRNDSINYLKRESIRQKHTIGLDEKTMDDIPVPALSMDELLLAKEKSSFLSIALKQLPEMERLILEGKYILEYSDEELAEQLGCKASSIRMKLTRARRRALFILSKNDWEGDDYDDEQAQSLAGTV
ncbi:MAG: sigma-70 family RNA polymerase sigma factor [Eubacteriales bacterium]|nr:sigma-70 family RNA polymerase sigma factor [Eubacteriales bacterium]